MVNTTVKIVAQIHEEKLITYNHFDVTQKMPIICLSLDLLQRNKDFSTPLEQANKMMPRFLLLGDSFTKKCSKIYKIFLIIHTHSLMW